MKTKVGLISVILICAVWTLFGWPFVEKAMARKKYPLGITLKEVQQKLTTPHIVIKSGIAFPDGAPSEIQKLTYSFYNLDVPENHVRLEFDYHQRLMEVRTIDHPISRLWRTICAGSHSADSRPVPELKGSRPES